MISDEERRETAARLRALHENHEWYDFDQEVDDIESAVGCNYDQPHKSQGLLLRLADLVDRPTCRFQPETAVHGIFSLFGICTRCGAIVDPLTAFCSDNRLMPANFCPCCGAEVVRDDY